LFLIYSITVYITRRSCEVRARCVRLYIAASSCNPTKLSCVITFRSSVRCTSGLSVSTQSCSHVGAPQ